MKILESEMKKPSYSLKERSSSLENPINNIFLQVSRLSSLTIESSKSLAKDIEN